MTLLPRSRYPSPRTLSAPHCARHPPASESFGRDADGQATRAVGPGAIDPEVDNRSEKAQANRRIMTSSIQTQRAPRIGTVLVIGGIAIVTIITLLMAGFT